MWEVVVHSNHDNTISILKRTTIDDLGVGPNEIEKKKRKPLVQEKIIFNFRRPSPG